MNMVHKFTIEEIVKKVDRKIDSFREATFYRIDFPAEGIPFDINQALALELSPNKMVIFTDKIINTVKTLAISVALFFIFFLLFNARAYFDIMKDDVLDLLTFQDVQIQETPQVPVEQELMVLSKDSEAQKQQFAELDLAMTPPDNRLIIPSIDKDIPIVEVDSTAITDSNWTNLNDDILNTLKNGVVRYPGTALPGEYGNTFITGHSSYYFWDDGQYKEVFALLSEVNIGDEIIVYYNQQKFIYEITEKKEVSPSEVDVLSQPTDQKQITLMTCTPVGTNLKRLIVVGTLVE